MTPELERLVGFGRFLRARGLPVGTGRILSFCRAAALLQPCDTEDLYWAARATLISGPQHFEAFERAFASYFASAMAKGSRRNSPRRSRPRAEVVYDLEVLRGSRASPGDGSSPGEDSAVGLVASDAEVLRHKSFEELSDDERARAAALIRRLAVDLPRRRTRRMQPAARGPQLDVRRTLRRSLRTQGEPFRPAWRARRTKVRSLVLVLDVSGSMSPYSRALLQFGFAAMAAGHRVEVFCFGTSLTRITRSLRTKDPHRALRQVTELVRDWDGGTRIGDSLHDLIDRYGRHAFLRGAVVVVCSDGLERGDPEVLKGEMTRLARLAYRVVWVNPLKGSPQYQPLARGMAAALPHVDLFLSGHNLASLEALGEVLTS